MDIKLFMICCIIYQNSSLCRSHKLPAKHKLNAVTKRSEYILNEIFMKNINNTEILRKQLKNYNKLSINLSVEDISSVNDLFVTKQTADKNYKEIFEYNTGEDAEGLISRQKTFLDHYYEGVKSYLSNDWVSCIHFLELSIQLYREYYNTITYCRIKCDSERMEINFLYIEDLEYHHFFEALLHKAICMEKCRQNHLGSYSKWFSFDTEQKIIFKTRKPYQYLQLCYYRDNEIAKAIQATYTALIVNSENELMRKNIRYYATLNDFNLESLKDLEDKEFSEFYLKGISHYENENWQGAIRSFEKFIISWILEHNKCRAFCDGEFYQGWLSDFVLAMSNHYVYTLRCKQNCTKELSYSNGRFYEDLLPSAYDYLQFSYYKVGKIKKACQCVTTYFLFYPNSEEMMETFKYYKNLDETDNNYFTERWEAKKFIIKEKYERDLLLFVDIEFSKLAEDEDQTFRQLSIQSDISGSKDTKANTDKTQNVDKT